jgi:hypothetical protein
VAAAEIEGSPQSSDDESVDNVTVLKGELVDDELPGQGTEPDATHTPKAGDSGNERAAS